jgi:hypothetical protein
MDWLDIGWEVISCCSWGSLVLMLAAIGVSGQYMVQKYRHPPRTLDDKKMFSREGRLRLAVMVFGVGLGLQALAILLANVVPAHH